VVQDGGPIQNILGLVRRALTQDPAALTVLGDEERLLEVAEPPVRSGEYRQHLLQRRAGLVTGGLLLAGAWIFYLVFTLAQLANKDGALPFVARLLALAGMAALIFALYRVGFLGWYQRRGERRLLILGLAGASAGLVIQALPVPGFPGGGGLWALLWFALAVVAALPMGLARAGVLTKTLWPAAQLPGYLLLAGAVTHWLLGAVILLVAYQGSGKAVFLLATVSWLGAAVPVFRAGLDLTRPMPEASVLPALERPTLAFRVATGLTAVFVLVALLAYMPWPFIVLGLGGLLAAAATTLLAGALLSDLAVNTLRALDATAHDPDAQALWERQRPALEAFGRDDDVEEQRAERMFRRG